MRIGIFGGTFDPIHLGHLIVAEQAREQASLDEVWFVPAARPPHKLDQSISPFDRRAEMISLAITGQPQFRLERIEKDRPGPSFTVDTLSELQTAHPEHTFALIVGADCLPDLKNWREPQRILELAELVVSARPGWPMMEREELLKSVALTTLRMSRVDVPQVEIASREIRQRTAEGRTIRYLTTRAVEEYIRERKLYL